MKAGAELIDIELPQIGGFFISELRQQLFGRVTSAASGSWIQLTGHRRLLEEFQQFFGRVGV
ncbi:MAG: hypothetical protein AAGB27_06915 [Pseudomonadota bacterium]